MRWRASVARDVANVMAFSHFITGLQTACDKCGQWHLYSRIRAPGLRSTAAVSAEPNRRLQRPAPSLASSSRPVRRSRRTITEAQADLAASSST
jgi:hypothetical protein